MILIKGTT